MILLPTAANLRYSYGLMAQLLHGLPPSQLDFQALGLADGGGQTRARQERVARAAIVAYNHAIGDDDPVRLAAVLDLFDPELRGFADEGAGLGLKILDLCTPWGGGRVARYLDQQPDRRALVMIGAGQALSALFRSLDAALAEATVWDRCFLADGYGFHQGFFRAKRALQARRLPAGVPPGARPFVDAGLGRCLWFREGGLPERLGEVVRAFPEERRGDLWAGVGFAAAYAGGAPRARLSELNDQAADDRSALLRGLALACRARLGAGDAGPQLDLASEALAGCSAAEVFARAGGALYQGAPTSEEALLAALRQAGVALHQAPDGRAPTE